MERRYKQMLIDSETHAEIKEAKEILYRMSGRKLNSKEVIDEFLGRRLRLLRLDDKIRVYINAFASAAAANSHVLGLLLFGSVAKGTFGPNSDIDILVVVDGAAMDYFDAVHDIIEHAEKFRVPLRESGKILRIMPIILSKKSLGSFRPIYIDFLEDGVFLFERNDVLTNFLNDIRGSVDYEKAIVGDSVMVRWRIKR